ncbi:MAG: MTAP family purine nucleoside phosphorylase [Deltaproteobacteria bacterium]|nr:MTAP family purine nucleoside phosphorylase [Deltaproteobacteria bacterium]
MMSKLAVLSGTIPILNGPIFARLEKSYPGDGSVAPEVFTGDDFLFISRDGRPGGDFTPPHLVNHLAHFQTLSELNVNEVIGIYSTGSLKADLQPGTLVVPDDFICLYPTPTSVTDTPKHITPVMDDGVRRELIRAAHELSAPVRDGGVYWQTSGPRLETKAEIGLMAGTADIVGMPLASEAVLAREFGMAFGALCSVDNYAHGIAGGTLDELDIRVQAARNAEIIGKIVSRYIENFRLRKPPTGRVLS